MSDSNSDGTTPVPPPAPPTPPAYDAPGGPPPPAPAPYDIPPAAAAPDSAPPYGAAPPAYGTAPTYGAPPAYGAAPAYAAPYGYAGPKTNTLAIVSLISSLVGLLIIPLIGSVAGIITGHMSLGQIKQTGEQGRGMALAGTIMGYIGLAFVVLGTIVFLAFLPLLIASVNTGT